jgi:hypothetical protein
MFEDAHRELVAPGDWRSGRRAAQGRGVSVGCHPIFERLAVHARHPCSVEPGASRIVVRPATCFARCYGGGTLRDGQLGASASLGHQTALAVYPLARKRCNILEGNQDSGWHCHIRLLLTPANPAPPADA